VQIAYTNRLIENELFWRGLEGYDPTSVRLWMTLAAGARTVLDIGANTGLFSLTAKAVNPAAEVWGFEPLPQFSDALQKNCDLNGFDIHVAPVALSNFTGRASFFVPELNQGNVYSSSLSIDHYLKHQSTKPQEHSVDVVQGDNFLRDNSIHNVDLIKVDAEGHDPQALMGLREVIEHDSPDVIVEIQDDEIGTRITELLPPDRYLYFLIEEGRGLLPSPVIKRGPDLNAIACSRSRPSSLAICEALLQA
jgi:FkbM family methyltransferase